MNKLKRSILRFLSSLQMDLKEDYKRYRKILNILNPPLTPIYKTFDHKIMVGDREIPIRAFFPKEMNYSNVIVFFHGGGWVTGNIDTYTNVCAQMANKTNSIVISVDYRLAPENPFPSGLEDCYYATKEIFLNLHLLKLEPKDIILIGDSAGGNLAAVVSIMARDRGEFMPKKQILIYPATYNDHSDNSPFLSVVENGEDYIMTSKRIRDYMDLYTPNVEDRLNPYVAPLLSEDLSNQPKTLIITAEYDPLRDEGEAYGSKLKEFGNYVEVVRIENALHGFISSPLASQHTEECYNIINEFLKDDN